MRTIATLLGAARTRLVLEQPFIGALLLHLPLVPAAAAWCPTTATDARAIYFNPDYVQELTLAQVQFVLAHEAMHCALGHFARRAHRTLRRWDVATDHAVNLLLIEEGLRATPGALADPRFRGLSAEEIYPLIPPDTPERAMDVHLFEGRVVDATAGPRDSAAARAGLAPDARAGTPAGASHAEPVLDAGSWDDAGDEPRAERSGGEPPALAAGDARELARLWQTRTIVVAQQARLAGRGNASLLRLADGLAAPQLPWRALLARFVMKLARDDYSFQRPSRRDGDALLPRLAGSALDLCVALDTSGSIAPEEHSRFIAEIDGLKGQVRARVTVMGCDERLDPQGPWVFQPWEPITLPCALAGGGGTSFVPVFDWLAGCRLQPDLLLYFTDGEGEFPREPPEFPVIWLVKGGGRVPWGERIQLN